LNFIDVTFAQFVDCEVTLALYKVVQSHVGIVALVHNQSVLVTFKFVDSTVTLFHSIVQIEESAFTFSSLSYVAVNEERSNAANFIEAPGVALFFKVPYTFTLAFQFTIAVPSSVNVAA
jgi:hypothetical protein